MLVMGDALAMVLLETRGFTEDDFAKFHPGGSLGRALLIKVRDIMRSGDQLATVAEGAKVVVHYHTNRQAAEGLAQELGDRALPLGADLRDEDQVAALGPRVVRYELGVEGSYDGLAAATLRQP